jgi:hypothetical protein
MRTGEDGLDEVKQTMNGEAISLGGIDYWVFVQNITAFINQA